MRGRRDDERAPSRGAGMRTVGMVGGFVLALGATLAVFLTDNPQYLRLAVIAAAWAFVLAAILAGRRHAESLAAADRIAEVRRRYEHELEREAAAHREYELDLENRVRRETEDSMRSELSALRREMSGVAGLREEVARVAGLRHDLAGLPALHADLASLSALRQDVAALSSLRHDVASLAALRHDVASLTALRDDVAALTALREDVASLAELRTDMGRLRAELTEQLNGEMLIERIMLRTQSIRPPAEAAPAEAPFTVEAPAAWEDDRPPRELTGGWPAVRLDEPRETRQVEQVRVQPAPEPAWTPPATSSWSVTSQPVAPEPVPWSGPTRASREVAEPAEPAPATAAFPFAAAEPASHRSRHSADEPAPVAVVPPRRRRTDEPADDRTAERPASPPTAYEPIVRPSPSPRPAARPTPHKRPAAAAAAEAEPETAGHQRLAEILAESGAQQPPGGRRRRRYRDEGEGADDVLSRVLGQS